MTGEAGHENEQSRPQSHGADESHGADLAALIGATIAVLLTVINTPGAWGPLSTIIGLLLLIVLPVFFWPRRPKHKQGESVVGQPMKRKSFFAGKKWKSFFSREKWKSFFAGKKWESIFIGFALSIVVGAVAAIASAQAVQLLWFSQNHSGIECRSVAVEQAAMAVHDFNDIYPNTKTLQWLMDDTLKNGHPSGPFVINKGSAETKALKIDFYDEYDDAIGNCLAGYTFNSLWWIGVPFFVLTFVLWNWNYIKSWPVIKKLGRILKNLCHSAAFLLHAAWSAVSTSR